MISFERRTAPYKYIDRIISNHEHLNDYKPKLSVYLTIAKVENT